MPQSDLRWGCIVPNLDRSALRMFGLRWKLRRWSKESFGFIKLQKLLLLHDLELIDVIKESRCLSFDEIIQERGLTESLVEIRKQEEVYWKQRSQVQWLKEGDENTKYFHSVANGRKNINFIPSINIGTASFTDAREIGKVFEQHFRALFGQRRTFRFKVELCNLLKNKAFVDLSSLERPFTLEEVKRAVFDLGSDKASGSDGFPMFFFKTYWEFVKGEVMQLCEDFYTGKANLERINWACIALIPKVLSPSTPWEYRSISLINSSLKIISKILASRLITVMDSLVDHTQSAFLKGRHIWDLISRTILWNIWLERNSRIFQLKALPSYIVIFRSANMLLSWLSTDSDSHLQPNTDASQKIKRSLNFLTETVSHQADNSAPDIAHE
ncbi:uncharacterized protein LOC120260245 [Dioscorea cayenensis subsp. rotundata]|uniref:Uncharacterized protein LOC120260245 n=1 Tax=Dioscorea cayennensis subsp. rotundata TaxID=55577 RepID=A0AB40B8N2_DIOCR|nr:uncharacterized protein LOC120260245 [Dioscorea cayenensis subsp. rotundata]